MISDFSVYHLDQSEYMSPVQAVYAQNDTLLTGIWLVQKHTIIKRMTEQYEKDPVGFGQALRTCCRNIIHMKMNASNFYSKKDIPSTIRIEGETASVSGTAVTGWLFWV